MRAARRGESTSTPERGEHRVGALDGGGRAPLLGREAPHGRERRAGRERLVDDPAREPCCQVIDLRHGVSQMVWYTAGHAEEAWMSRWSRMVHRARSSRSLGGGRARAAAQEPQDLIVQSTTSVRDSGLLEQVIIPDFQEQYPQWRLKVVAVGTGQAIANARAGQGDVLIAHSPAQEARFVADGFSLEPEGRTIMWNDFVIVGPQSDPAGGSPPGATTPRPRFEAIAAAGAQGGATSSPAATTRARTRRRRTSGS